MEKDDLTVSGNTFDSFQQIQRGSQTLSTIRCQARLVTFSGSRKELVD